MTKVKIAFCLRDMQLGGVESVLIRTLDELLKNTDFDISVITYVNIKEPVYKRYFEEHKEIKTYVLYPCKFLGTKLPHFSLYKIVLYVMRDIYRSVKRIFFRMNNFSDIDVFVDCHDFVFFNELKYVKNSKKIAWFHSSFDVFVKNNFVKKLSGYDKVVVLTDAMFKDLQKLYPQKSDRFVRIYNPVDTKQIIQKSKEKNKLNGDYFCAVSRLSYDKDIITLLKGFDDFWISNKKPDVRLVIVGDGDKADVYKKYAHELKSNKQILFVGATNNPYVYMKYALAHILSSYGEGFGLVLVESVIVGTLNIASDCKYGPREILLDGKGGLLYEPGNFKQLSKCMSDVYNKNIDVKQMIKVSKDANIRFDKDVFVKNFISLIS